MVAPAWVPPDPREAGHGGRARGLSCAAVVGGTRAEAVVVPCEARDLYLAYPGDSEEETCPEDPGTRRVASCREGEDLVNQMEEGRVTA